MSEVQNLLKQLKKISGNEYADIVSENCLGNITEYLDTGCYALNLQISGDMFKGIPTNRTIGLAGVESVGKTFLVASVAKNFLDKYKEGIVIYFDSENAVNEDFFKERKMDTSRILLMPVDTVENFRSQAVNMINELNKGEEKKILMILDSLGSLSSKKEMQDIEEGKEKVDMTRQKMIRGAFRVLNLKLAKHKIPLLITSHVYQDMNSFYPTQIIAGGGGLKYAASIILMLVKSQYKDKDNTVVGGWITSTTIKSRLTKEKTKIKALLHFTMGLYPYSFLSELAIESKIWKKVHGGIEIAGEKIKENDIISNPKKYFTDDFLKKLNEELKSKFCFGSATGDDGWDKIEKIEEEKVILPEVKEENIKVMKEGVQPKKKLGNTEIPKGLFK